MIMLRWTLLIFVSIVFTVFFLEFLAWFGFWLYERVGPTGPSILVLLLVSFGLAALLTKMD